MISVCALVDDVHRYRISNYIIVAGGVLQVIMLVGDMLLGRAWGTYLLGAVVSFALMYVIHLLGGVGAGDVKLLGVVGGFIGMVPGILLTVGALCVGAVIGILSIIRHRYQSTELALPGQIRMRAHGFHYTIAVVIAQVIITFYYKGGGVAGA